jgi:hypothetical protein
MIHVFVDWQPILGDTEVSGRSAEVDSLLIGGIGIGLRW